MNDDLQNPVQSQLDAMTGSTPASVVNQPQEQESPVLPQEDTQVINEEPQEQPEQPQETYVKDGKTVTADELDPNEPIIPYSGGVASPGVVYSNAEVDPQASMAGKQYLRFKKVKPYKLQMPDGGVTVTDTLDAEKARYQYLALSRDQVDPSDWYGYNPITPWRPTQVGSFFRGAANTITSIPFDLVSLGAIAVGAPETAKASQEAFTHTLELHPGSYWLDIPERKWGMLVGSGVAAALGFIGTGGAAGATKVTGMAGKALALSRAAKATQSTIKAVEAGAKAASRAKAIKAFARAQKFDKMIAKANLMPLRLQKVGTGFNWYMSAGEGANSAVNIYEDALSKGVNLESATFEALLGGGLVAAVGQAPEFLSGVTGMLSNVSVKTAQAALKADKAALKSLFWKNHSVPAAVYEAISEVGQDMVEAGFTGEELDATTEWATAMLALVMAGGLSAVGKNKFVEGSIKYAEDWKTNTKAQIDALYNDALSKGVKLPKSFVKLAYAMVDDPSLTPNLEELVQKGYLEQIDKMNDLDEDQKEQLREIFSNPDLNVSDEAWNALDDELDFYLGDSNFTPAQKEAIKSIMHGFAVHSILDRTISSPSQLLDNLRLNVFSSPDTSGTTALSNGKTVVEINTNDVNQLPQGMQSAVDTTGMTGNRLISAQAKNNAQNKDKTSMEQSGVVGDAIHELIGHFLGGDKRKANAFIQYFQKMTEALAEVYPEGNKEGKLSTEEAEEYRAYAMQMSNKFVAEVLGMEGRGAEMLNFLESAMLARQANVAVLQNYVKALKTIMEQNATMVQAMIKNHEDAEDLSASIKQFAKTGDAGSLTAEDLEALQRVFRSGLSDSDTKLDLASLIGDASTYEKLSDRLKGQYEAAMAADRQEAAAAKESHERRVAQTASAQKATEGVSEPTTPRAVMQSKEALEEETAPNAKAPEVATEPSKGVNIEGTEYKLLTKEGFEKDIITNPRQNKEYSDEYLIDQAVHGEVFSKDMIDRYTKSVVKMFSEIPGGDQYLDFAKTLDYKNADVRYERILDENGNVVGYDAKYYGEIPGGEITEANARTNAAVPTAKISSAIAYGITIKRMRHNDNKTKYAVQGIVDIANVVKDTLSGYTDAPFVDNFTDKMMAAASKAEEAGNEADGYNIAAETLFELRDELSSEDKDRPVVEKNIYFAGDVDEYKIPTKVRYNGKMYQFHAEESKADKTTMATGVQPEHVVDTRFGSVFAYGFAGGKALNVDDIVNNVWRQAEAKQKSAAEGFEMHSGGAEGADTVWGDVAKDYGISVNHYYAKGNKTPSGNVEVSQEALDAAKQHVLKANETLKRNISNISKNVLGLLERNYEQVSHSDAVFAVGVLKNTQEVDGGTGWAVQMAIDANKPVYVFDQNKAKWFVYDSDTQKFKVFVGTPTLTRNFAGIGTRKINQAGKKAIADAFKQSFGTVESYITDDLVDEVIKSSEQPTQKYTLVAASERELPIGNKLAKQVVSKMYSLLESTGNIIHATPVNTYESATTLGDFIDGALAYFDDESRKKIEEKDINFYQETKGARDAKNFKISKKDKGLVPEARPESDKVNAIIEKYVADVYKKRRIKNKEMVLEAMKDLYRKDYASWGAYRDAVRRSVERIDEYAKSTNAQIETQSRMMGYTPEDEQEIKNMFAEKVQAKIDVVQPHARKVDFIEGKEASLNEEKAKIEAILSDPEVRRMAETTLMKMGVLRGYFGKEKYAAWGPLNTAERNIEDAKKDAAYGDMPVTEGHKFTDEEGNERTEETLSKEPQKFVVEGMQPERYGFQGDELDNALRITGTKRENFSNVIVPEEARTQVEFYDAYLQAAKAKIQAYAKKVAPVTRSKNEGLNTQASLKEFHKKPENQLYEIGALHDAAVAAKKAFADRFSQTVDYLAEQSKEKTVVQAEDSENQVGFVEDLPVVDMLPISNEAKKLPMFMVHGRDLKTIYAGNVIKMYYDGAWVSGVVTYWSEANGNFAVQGINENGEPVEFPIIASQLVEADDAYHNPVFMAPIVPLSPKEIEAFNDKFEEKLGGQSILTKTREVLGVNTRIGEEINPYSANPEEIAMTKFAVQGNVVDWSIGDDDFLMITAKEADYYKSHMAAEDLNVIKAGNPNSQSAVLTKFDTPETTDNVFGMLGDISKARETMDKGPKITMGMFANSRIAMAKPLTGGGSVEEIREKGKYLPTLKVHGTLSEVLDNMLAEVNSRKYKSFLIGALSSSGVGRSARVLFGDNSGIVTNVEAVAQEAQSIRERSTERNMRVVRDALSSEDAKNRGVTETYMDWNIGRTMDSKIDAEIYGGRTRKITRGEVMGLYVAQRVQEATTTNELGIKEFKYPIKVVNGGNAIYNRLKQTYTNADELIDAMPECDRVAAEALLDDAYMKNPDNFTVEVGDFDKMTEFGYGLRSKNYKRLSAAEAINPSVHLGVIDLFNAMDKHNAAIAIRQSGIADFYKMFNGLFEIGTYTSVDALAEKFDLVIATEEDRKAGEALIEKSRALNAALEAKLSPRAYEAFRRQLADAVKTGSVLEDDLPVSSSTAKWFDRITRGGQAAALFAKPKNAVLNMLSSYMRTGALTTGTLKHNTVDLVNAIAHIPQALQYARDFQFLQDRFQRNQLGTEFEKAVDTTSVDSALAELSRWCANNQHATWSQLSAQLDKFTKKLTEYGVGYATAGADYLGLVMSWYNVGPKLIQKYQADGMTYDAAKAKAQEMFQWQTLRTVSSSNYATRGPLQKWLARHHLEAVCAFLNDTIQSWASLAENVHELYNTTDAEKRAVLWRTINSNLAAQAFYISVQAAAWSALASILFGDGLSDEEEEALQEGLIRETIGQLTGIFGAGSEYVIKPMVDSLVFGKGSAQANIALAGPMKALQEFHNGQFFRGMADLSPAVGIVGVSRVWDLVDAMGYVFEGGEGTKLGLEQMMGFSKTTAMKQLGQKQTKSGKIVAK